ncbi:MAG: NAD(P)/FAD-dependent oxidoreductase [Candidatus Kariarchaeaceae archaeon]|jgi:geranylgeranyl reductase family protein
MTDVIVVGGGPAGVSCAYTLAKLGKSVVLLDKKKHTQIGNKTCGDALDISSPRILNEAFGLDLPHGDEVSDKVTKMNITTKNKTITLDAPGYTVDRHIYGQRLLKECEELGVTVIDQAPVREILLQDSYVKGVKYLKDGELKEIRANLVADCSGIIGAVRSRLPEDFSFGLHPKIPDHHIAASFREIVEMKEDHPWPEEIVLSYDPEIPPPGYLWFFTKGEKQLNIGTGWLKSENKLFKYSMRQIYREALDNYYTKDVDYTIKVTGGGQIPIRPPFDCLTFNGGILVGDAGCLVDPTTAEGHGPALVAGYYGGKALADAVDKKEYSREALWQYNLDVMEEYGRRNAISYVTLQILREIEADGMDFVLRRRILTETELKAVFYGESLNTGLLAVIGKVVRSFPRFGILMKLRVLVRAVKQMSKIYEKYPSDPSKLAIWKDERDTALGEVL